MGKYRIEINKKWCKECYICSDLCPQGVLKASENDKIIVQNIDECSGCRLCEYRCPDYAIKVEVD